ncbi:tyrosine-protein phosphatase [Streptomonospora wellingtoniae]|uniref:Tyrosine-protein phosphatase n=1 Tax=Streptomonospora wellingtoniae TaxID=3075544 RepID=A0ABU2KWP1_9ACTN|nr:tyrosine-protein phosphatase [Streptomonospora sp. DSM 45055]MDT0303641.1 tyrosine-protein phosphatase [Streptomonospora sp. DSM 45055]
MTYLAPAPLSTAPNFRDLGGHATLGGGRIRPGVVFRSDALDRVDSADMCTLEQAGVRRVIDLRTSFERESRPDRLPEGADHVVLDVQGDHSTGADLVRVLTEPGRARTVFGDGGATRFMHEVNRVLVSAEDARAGYAAMVRHIAAGPGASVVHCTAGKDRTGWAAALLLEMLGVPRETVFADYLASNDRLVRIRELTREACERSGVDPAIVAPMTECRRAYLEDSYAEVERVFGTFDDYVRDGLGLDRATVDGLRDRMLE